MATLQDVMHYFEMRPVDFRKEWAQLSKDDKAQIKQGLEDGSLTY